MPIKTDDVSSVELPECTPEGEGIDQTSPRRRGTRRSISVDSTRNKNVRINVSVCSVIFIQIRTYAYFNIWITELYGNQISICQERSIGRCLKTKRICKP